MRRLIVILAGSLALSSGCDRLFGTRDSQDDGPSASADAKPQASSWEPSSGERPPPAESAPGSWIEFASKAGRFEVEFPRAPATEVSPVPVGDLMVDMTTYSVEDKEAYYAVATSDYPPELVSDPMRVLDGARDGATANIGGKLAKEAQTEVDGHSARRITIHAENEGVALLVDSLIVLVDNRLYQAIVVRPTTAADDSVTRFLSSFHPVP